MKLSGATRKPVGSDDMTTSMPTQKTAISVPPALLSEVDEIAAARGESRSAFINRILTLAVKAKRDERITERLNSLFADATLRRAHEASAIRTSDDDDQNWASERW